MAFLNITKEDLSYKERDGEFIIEIYVSEDKTSSMIHEVEKCRGDYGSS